MLHCSTTNSQLTENEFKKEIPDTSKTIVEDAPFEDINKNKGKWKHVDAVESENESLADEEYNKESKMLRCLTKNELKEEIPDTSKTIVEDVTFVDAPLEAIKNEKKRKRVDEPELENKRLADEEYNRQIHEQRYKRLLHLLNQSQFYSNYLVEKINGSTLAKDKKEQTLKPVVQNENVSPNASVSKRKIVLNSTYDVREYITMDMEKKLKSTNSRNSREMKKEKTENSSPETSVYFNGELRDYQHEGIKWLHTLYENGVNGILADEMGLGKTVQVIALFCSLLENKQGGPYLIVAPLSTLPNWMMEFERFAPELPVILFHGNQQDRSPLYSKIKRKYSLRNGFKTQPVVLTSFEVPLREKKFLTSQKWRYIVVDEGHRIKNPNCLLIQILKSLHSMNRLLLTGTPLQNNLAELWSLLNFLLPEVFNDLPLFESWFDPKTIQNKGGTEKILKQEEEQQILGSLREILKPFMLRRIKNDVCLDIPPKKEIIVYAPVTQLQHELYKAVIHHDLDMLRKIDEKPLILDDDNGVRPQRKCALRKRYYPSQSLDAQQFTDSESEDSKNYAPDDSKDSEPDDSKSLIDNKSQLNANEKVSVWNKYLDITERNRDFLVNLKFGNRVTMYKRIINHPYLVHCPLDSTGLPLVDEDLVKTSGKLLVLDAMLKIFKARGHKVLLFSTWTMILDMLEDYLSMRDYLYVRLDGAVKIEDRKKDIHAFNTDPNIFLFLLSTRAGGIGLNLAGADTVIIYDSDWNPQVDIQAMARCHRIGQTRPVVVYRMCTKGTIDETILRRADSKRILEKMVMSKELGQPNLTNETALLELKRLLESKEYEVVTSEKEVYTQDELERLLDRSDMTNPQLMKKE